MGKQMDFDSWFEAQYGGLPRPADALRLAEKIKHLKTELGDAEGRLQRLTLLQQAYTSALYARQAFDTRRQNTTAKRGNK